MESSAKESVAVVQSPVAVSARPLWLTDHETRWSFTLPDERLARLPLVSTHDHPQIGPQEYACGCVTVVRVTDRDVRRGERPFEMRLARSCGTCGTDVCELIWERPKGVR